MTQLTLFPTPQNPPTAPHVAGSETSKAAAEQITPHVSWLQGIVLEFIRYRGAYGATDAEIVEELETDPSTARPRRVELRDAGLIVDSGCTRPSPSKHPMTVWVAKEQP